MTDETLWCPFTGKPCIGRQCACAVYALDGDLNRTWWCGMVPCADGTVRLSPVDHQGNGGGE